jgi:hypothetical protein
LYSVYVGTCSKAEEASLGVGAAMIGNKLKVDENCTNCVKGKRGAKVTEVFCGIFYSLWGISGFRGDPSVSIVLDGHRGAGAQRL